MSAWSDAIALSQRVTIAAKEEASRWGDPAIDIDHMLVALTVLGGQAGQVLRKHGIDLNAARDAVRAEHDEAVRALGVDVPSRTPGAIRDPAASDVDYSPRAMKIMRTVRDYSNDLELLTALLDEPSGLVRAIVARTGADARAVRDGAVRTRAEHAVGVRRKPRTKPGPKIEISHSVFVPASPDAVWELISEPARRPEWDPGVGLASDLGDGVWELRPPDRRPDGRPAKVAARARRSTLREISREDGERIIWERTWPDASGRKALSQRREIVLAPAEGGSKVTLVFTAPRVARFRGPLGPFSRAMARQNMVVQAAGISRALR